MISKIVGILISLMLIATFLSVATNVENVELKKMKNAMIATGSNGDDVPIWNIGYKWIYKIKDIVVENEDENKTIHVDLQINELPFEVIDDSTFYKLEFSAKIKGNYSIFMKEENSTTDVEGRLYGTTINGSIFYTKSELGIKKMDYEISGILTVKINELPEDFNIPEISFPLPIPATITTTLDFGTPYTYLNFPLNVSKTWGLPATNFTVNGKIQSIWLTIINIINEIFTAFGNPLLPEETADLLPVVDIKEALEIHGIDNIFNIPEVPSIFAIFKINNESVPAGDFLSYNISVAPINLTHALGRIYYAPKVKNIIKISGQLGDILPFTTGIEMELIDYDIE